jgi:Nucleotidyltransferase of unknown function (DUF6036)
VQFILEISGADQADRLLEALEQQLQTRGASYHLVVVGGSALLALGLVDRPTKDVDLVALSDGTTLSSPSPLPADLVAARDKVARDFGLPIRSTSSSTRPSTRARESTSAIFGSSSRPARS